MKEKEVENKPKKTNKEIMSDRVVKSTFRSYTGLTDEQEMEEF